MLAFVAFVAAAPGPAGAANDDLLAVPAGAFVMGDPEGDANEVPRETRVGSFRIMRHEVTNRQFAAFVAATGYRTDAEEAGAGFVWDGRWRNVAGAPSGAGSTIEGLSEHPVVQVSARDAEAYCAHYGHRLPTEAEWEYAARGVDGRRFPWGNAPPRQGSDPARANFGTVACCAPSAADGYGKTAPVGSYPQGASPFAVLDMAGNVWEWTATAFPGRPDERAIRGGGWGNDPYCLRASYRHGNPPHFSLDMVGFRCAADP
jgi:formylglycine-generating enzyme required for sulfatase activity